jgi:hypothetical protein
MQCNGQHVIACEELEEASTGGGRSKHCQYGYSAPTLCFPSFTKSTPIVRRSGAYEQ